MAQRARLLLARGLRIGRQIVSGFGGEAGFGASSDLAGKLYSIIHDPIGPREREIVNRATKMGLPVNIP